MKLTYNLEAQHYIEACVRKERWAQEALYREYYPVMMPICLRYASNKGEALDILHDGFIKIFQHIHTYNMGTSLEAWMKRVMVNTAIDLYRRETRRRTEDLDMVLDLSAPDINVISKMAVDDILECLQALPTTYRAIFNLFVIEGYSHKEIAAQLGINESTSRSSLVKARTRLKSLLEAKNISYGK